MRGLLLLALLGAASQDPPAAPEDAPAQAVSEPRPPGPRKAIAGLAGFQSDSRVVFVDLPEDPHRLEVAYLFPDRARWMLAREGSPARRIEYRLGERFFALPDARTASVEYADAEARVQLLQKELRRAVMMWPDGFAWSGEGSTRRAPVLPLSGDPESAGAGVLLARLGPGGRPERIEVLRSDGGTALESLEIAAWQTVGERSWPARMRLAVGGRTVWEETVEAVQTRVNLLDAYFLPPDRRSVERPPDEGQVVRTRLRAHAYRVHPLPQGTGWEAALERFDALRAEAAEELGEPLVPDPVPTFRLDGRGRPEGAVLRLETPSRPAPEGWTTVAEREGLSVVLSAWEDLDAALLEALAERVPPARRAGQPYARLYQGGARIQVALPLL